MFLPLQPWFIFQGRYSSNVHAWRTHDKRTHNGSPTLAVMKNQRQRKPDLCIIVIQPENLNNKDRLVPLKWATRHVDASFRTLFLRDLLDHWRALIKGTKLMPVECKTAAIWRTPLVKVNEVDSFVFVGLLPDDRFELMGAEAHVGDERGAHSLWKAHGPVTAEMMFRGLEFRALDDLEEFEVVPS